VKSDVWKPRHIQQWKKNTDTFTHFVQYIISISPRACFIFQSAWLNEENILFMDVYTNSNILRNNTNSNILRNNTNSNILRNNTNSNILRNNTNKVNSFYPKICGARWRYFLFRKVSKGLFAKICNTICFYSSVRMFFNNILWTDVIISRHMRWWMIRPTYA